MRTLLRSILDKTPYISKLRKQIRDLIKDAGQFPAGHYYSPIPNRDEIESYFKTRPLEPRSGFTQLTSNPGQLPEQKLDQENQFTLLQQFEKYYQEIQFPEHSNLDFRYYYEQGFFRYADAIFLSCFLRYVQPKRIIEVGSGFSTAVMLDTVEHYLDQTQIICIEPFPERLYTLLKPHDKEKIQIIEKKVQTVPIEIFASLKSGDLLFIDSTHVVKYGNDLHFLLFDVLPHLSVGTYIHFHDIFYPFEYPMDWLKNGVYWNEAYFLRAFLAYNNSWKIFFYNTFIAATYKQFLAEKMPLCLRDTGGSLYIQRVDHPM